MMMLLHRVPLVTLLMFIASTIQNATTAPTSSGNVDYTGYQVISTHVSTPEQSKALHNLLDTDEWTQKVDIWQQTLAPGIVELAVSSEHMAELEQMLASFNLTIEVKISDLQGIINTEASQLNKLRAFSLNSYNSYDQITSYLSNVASACQSPYTCEVIEFGTSTEGRPLKVFKISKSGSNRKAAFIEAGIHAREWASPAVALKTIDKMTGSVNKQTKKLLDACDWYILPSLNPDGYEYSRLSDRLWRKTRSHHGGNCYGVDGNRNFDFHWGETGSSSNCRSEIFRGPEPFSEPETKSWSEFVSGVPNKKIYIAMHSYGQYILVPWGYTYDKPTHFKQQVRVANQMKNQIKKARKKDYTAGHGALTLYPVSGASDDWTYGNQNIIFSMTIELRDKGSYGFLLPASRISPAFNDFWVGLKTMVKKAKIK